jgi:NTP pyrophosphatase (non-canonical NTP hydrolase)
MDFSEWQHEVHQLALLKGWWPHGTGDDLSTNMILAKLALVHSEVSEAVEAAREGNVTFGYIFDGSGKPEGMVVELADAVIRILDLCEALHLDLEHALERKHEYNATRPHRHGGKLA